MYVTEKMAKMANRSAISDLPITIKYTFLQNLAVSNPN